ncbi:MAG: hypothetical protein HEP80_07530 [Dolichospermum sp. UKL201]|nr:hypothetical protein [Anabaena sp. AL09]QSV53747.1 MAG: hypothetical protein HEP80_07530 [Dolichospermum sp. UKL201]
MDWSKNLFDRLLGSQTENEFRFKLHQRDDENRELLMTVLVFDLKLRKIT